MAASHLDQPARLAVDRAADIQPPLELLKCRGTSPVSDICQKQGVDQHGHALLQGPVTGRQRKLTLFHLAPPVKTW